MNVYYVYAYLREDGTPYYIGKGKGRRITGKHTVAVPSISDRRIKLQENLTELEAHKLEMELISKYGRKDLGTGILRNQTDGGQGTSGWVPPQEYRDNLRSQRIGKSYEERYGKKKADRIKKRLSNAVSGEKNGFYGKTHTKEVIDVHIKRCLGKTYQMRYGEEKALSIKKQQSKTHTGRPGTTTGMSFEEIHGEEKARKLKEQYRDSMTGNKNPFYGKKHSAEHLEKKRQEKLTAKKIKCPHCEKSADPMNYSRWHGDKCKHKDLK